MWDSPNIDQSESKQADLTSRSSPGTPQQDPHSCPIHVRILLGLYRHPRQWHVRTDNRTLPHPYSLSNTSLSTNIHRDSIAGFKFNTLFMTSNVEFEKWLAQTLLPAQIAAIEKIAMIFTDSRICRGTERCFEKFHEFENLKTVKMRARESTTRNLGNVGRAWSGGYGKWDFREANRNKTKQVVLRELPWQEWKKKCWQDGGRRSCW